MTIEHYVHHGKYVAVDSALKGKHREHCLCYKCVRFVPSDPVRNCHIAQELFEKCVQYDLVTPVYECPIFREVPDAPRKST